jgi:hydroxypyruvate reductase
MPRTTVQLREDAQAIWQAAVRAVDSRQLVMQQVRLTGQNLHIGDDVVALDGVRRIIVVGAGKAGAGMAEGIEAALGTGCMSAKDLVGWVNVPADCVRPLARIRLHGARPPGLNEPTEAGVRGAQQILQLVSAANSEDLCICLVSGGGSALLPAPVAGISLEDKQAVTKHLSAAGANIVELNTVRKHLSRIKGGGLARACRAGRLHTLIVSDVLGDPLEVIASGPTVLERSLPRDALAVLERFSAREAGISPRVFAHLQTAEHASSDFRESRLPRIVNLIIGNNAVAVDAAGMEAERRGYAHAMVSSGTSEGPAEEIGTHLARMARHMRAESGPDCLITGGEPVVRLAPAHLRGLGGRNQQLVLAALIELLKPGAAHPSSLDEAKSPLTGVTILSGGTDGEDGPTDAAGAWIDASVLAPMRAQQLDPASFLGRNDAYHFFQAVGTLLKTGPTHTNVCDVRVVTVQRE